MVILTLNYEKWQNTGQNQLHAHCAAASPLDYNVHSVDDNDDVDQHIRADDNNADTIFSH